MKFFKKSTPKLQSDPLDELTNLIKGGQYDAFRTRMVVLTESLGVWPTLFSTLLVEVVFYLSRDDQSGLRSKFYHDLIKYTAPQKLADSLNRRGDELWKCVLKEIVTSGHDITEIPYSSTETFRDTKQWKGVKWETETFQHNYCLIMFYPLKMLVALAVTGLEGSDLKEWKVKIDKTIEAIDSQSKEVNPLPYQEFKAGLSQQPWWTQDGNSLDG